MSGNKTPQVYQSELEQRLIELEEENNKLKSLLSGSIHNRISDSSCDERLQNEKIQTAQNKILQMVASGASLEDVLNEIIRFIELESNGAYGSIVLLEPDGKSVRTCAAPNLPRGYNNEVNGIQIGPLSGSCGTAMFYKKMIIVSDIKNSELWAQYGDIPFQYNLKACTSIPIIGSGNQILGSFAFYYQKQYTPSAFEIKLIEASSALAGIAIEKDRTEKALRESEELHRLIAENISAIICIFDGEGNMIYANNMALQTLGLSRENIIGKKVFDFIHPEDQEKAMKALDLVHMGLASNLIFRIKTYNGSWRWIEASEKLLRKENDTHILALGRDITERKEAEDALRVSEEKFRTSFEYANSGMALFGIDGTFIKVNSAWNHMIGNKENELTGQNALALLHSEDVEESMRTLQSMIEGKTNSCNGEKRLKHVNGHYIWGFVSTSIIRDNNFQPLYFICMMEDITERKATEETQKQLTEDLIRQNKDLEQFSYITSHNLRAPIANILGLVDLLTNHSDDEDLANELLKSLKKAASNLDTIIKDLNSIITLKKGIETNKEEISFSNVTDGILRSLERQICQSETSIETDFSEAPTIHSVQTYAQSIISNLIENAIKYRSPKRKLHIKLQSKQVNGIICLSVTDNGLGINLKKYGSSIFGMYKRFHLHVEGRGLGLYLVKTQIEAMGGQIEVESELDKGTTFKVYFRKTNQ